jgi:hypothetical protein
MNGKCREKMDNSKLGDKSSRFELIIAGIGSAACVVLSTTLWISLASTQSTWLLPGAYFLEIMVGAVVCFFAFLNFFQWASMVSWIFSGMLIVFSVLTGFTVGIFYFPVFFIFSFLSIFSDIKHKKPIAAHLGIFLCAGIIQLGLMILVIRIYTLFH